MDPSIATPLLDYDSTPPQVIAAARLARRATLAAAIPVILLGALLLIYAYPWLATLNSGLPHVLTLGSALVLLGIRGFAGGMQMNQRGRERSRAARAMMTSALVIMIIVYAIDILLQDSEATLRTGPVTRHLAPPMLLVLPLPCIAFYFQLVSYRSASLSASRLYKDGKVKPRAYRAIRVLVSLYCLMGVASVLLFCGTEVLYQHLLAAGEPIAAILGKLARGECTPAILETLIFRLALLAAALASALALSNRRPQNLWALACVLLLNASAWLAQTLHILKFAIYGESRLYFFRRFLGTFEEIETMSGYRWLWWLQLIVNVSVPLLLYTSLGLVMARCRRERAPVAASSGPRHTSGISVLLSGAQGVLYAWLLIMLGPHLLTMVFDNWKDRQAPFGPTERHLVLIAAASVALMACYWFCMYPSRYVLPVVAGVHLALLGVFLWDVVRTPGTLDAAGLGSYWGLHYGFFVNTCGLVLLFVIAVPLHLIILQLFLLTRRAADAVMATKPDQVGQSVEG